FSGRIVTAEEAHAIGLVDRVLAPSEVYPTALEEAARYASGPTLAYRAAKIALNAAAQGDQVRGLEVEREVFRDLFATVEQKEGMRAFLEKRDPVFLQREWGCRREGQARDAGGRAGAGGAVPGAGSAPE